MAATATAGTSHRAIDRSISRSIASTFNASPDVVTDIAMSEIPTTLTDRGVIRIPSIESRNPYLSGHRAHLEFQADYFVNIEAGKANNFLEAKRRLGEKYLSVVARCALRLFLWRLAMW